ncbi:MAG: ATP-binding protein [Candidatus Izemoplasmatales bacterium]
MKRRISFEFIILIITAFVVFTVGVTFIVKDTINKTTELNLEKYLTIITIDNETLSESEIIEKYKNLSDYLRLTFIDSDGKVISDSLAENLDNHLDRPEILNIGDVYTRYSDTLRIDMMYLATQLSDGGYLRVAIPVTSFLGFLNDFVALSLVIGSIIIILSIIISNYLIKQSLKPLKDINNILVRINKGEYQEILPIIKYEEVNELIKEINKINKNISDNITSLKLEKQKADFLLNHMNQGICVLDENLKIVLLNSYLRDLYNFNINYNINKDYRFLFRDEEIQKKIQNAYDTRSDDVLVVFVKDKYYSVAIIYSEKDWSFCSSLILIYSDITSLKNIEKLKRDFFINASHELKSPLTTIIGSADLITQKIVLDEETVTDLVNRIASEAKRMNNLVMDMLALSEYELNNNEKQKRIIDIAKVVDEVVNNLSVLASKNNIKINVDVNKMNIYISFEEVYQILKNLLENAIKYNKVNGNVWIKTKIIDKNLLISVKDDGIGIPTSDIHRVFERFYRVDKARSRSTGGTGLGLSIVKHIVLNYNGYVDLKSKEEEGTEVLIYIPKKELNIDYEEII